MPSGLHDVRRPLTVEDWALRYIESTELSAKTDPAPPPEVWQTANTDNRPVPNSPGRPSELRVTLSRPKSVKGGALVRPEARARLHHKFWHHELQAAELMCWALLAFPNTPQDFKRGLVRISRDEVRHMKMYQKHIEDLGFSLSSFEVRDWFWDRVPTATTPLQFVALLGMGLEGANLDHTVRFAAWLRAVGDFRGAELQEQVGREEVAHVRFANRWFKEWTGGVDFERWKQTLPPPLSPLLMRGKTIQVEARLKAEFPQDFIDRLTAWHPEESLG